MRYWVLPIVLAIMLIYGAIKFGLWMDRRDERHLERVARESRTACKSDRTIDAKAHDKGWWYEIKCQTSSGEVYVVVVR